MKIKQLLTKTLLVAAGLLVGQSVLAVDVASYDFNGQTTPFTISDANRLSASYAKYAEEGDDYYVKYTSSNMNAVAFAYYNFSGSVTDAATVTIDFDFNISQVAGHLLISLADANYHTMSEGGFTGKSNTGYGSNGAIFNLGCYRANDKNEFAINSSQKSSLTSACLGKWCHATVTVNNATKKVTYTIKDSNGTPIEGASGTDVNYINVNAQRCTQIDLYIGTNASGNAVQVDNLVITKNLSDVSHNYKVNAVAGGTTIKQEIITGEANEGAQYTISGLPYVIEKDSKFYVLDDAQVSNFGVSYFMGNADQVKEINYTLDESIIYFKEAEDINSSQKSAGNYSGGYTCGYYANPVTVTISTTGVYQLQTNVTGRDSNSSLEVYTPDGTTSVALIPKNSGLGIKTVNFLATGNMRVGGPYYANSGQSAKFQNSKGVDYVLVRKLYDVADANTIIGSVNYSTGYLDDMSNKVTLAPGESYKYKFINYNSGSSSQWLNYVVPVYTSADVKTLVIRADNWEDMKGTNAGCTNNFVWGVANATFISEMNGAIVDMTINYSASNVLTMNAAIKTKSGYDWTYSYRTDYSESGITLTGDIKVALSVSNSWLELVYEGTTGTVTKTISDAGWATYCSPYALDLSNATGLTDAYIVTDGENGVLAKTSVKDGTVPANTGLLLKGNEGTATIPVVVSSSTDVSANKLVGVTAETQIAEETGYVLLKENDVLGFYKNTNAFTLGANTAYLPVSFDQNGAARASYLLFDDMTGISQVAGSKVKTNGAIYNLNGQRVSNPTKGIYIIDGVKVAIE